MTHVQVLVAFTVGSAAVLAGFAGFARLVDIDGAYNLAPLRRLLWAALLCLSVGAIAALMHWGAA